VAAKAEQLMRMRRRIEIVNLSGNWCEKKIVETSEKFGGKVPKIKKCSNLKKKTLKFYLT
jgi:hypothetical protein